MADEKGKHGICWVSMASGNPVYCMGKDCQGWNQSKGRPQCLIHSIGTISWYIRSIANFMIWGGKRAQYYHSREEEEETEQKEGGN